MSEVMRKHGLKSASKRERLLALAQDEADETLDKMVSLICSSTKRLNKPYSSTS